MVNRIRAEGLRPRCWNAGEADDDCWLWLALALRECIVVCQVVVFVGVVWGAAVEMQGIGLPWVPGRALEAVRTLIPRTPGRLSEALSCYNLPAAVSSRRVIAPACGQNAFADMNGMQRGVCLDTSRQRKASHDQC